jgi:hypothetical protein
MSGDNSGNGFNPVQIDVNNDANFRTGMVKYMQMLVDRTDCLPDLKKKVEKHDRVYHMGKWLVVPALAAFHVGLKSLLSKLGW